MSYRNIPPTGDEMARMLRDILDRIDKLEQGGAITGRVSFGPVIQIGDVTITITDGAGNHRNVVFQNVLSGATSTITL